MARGWAPIESDPRWQSEGYYEEVKAKADGLALWWSQLHDQGERDQWRREADAEDGRYDGEDYPRASWYDQGEQDPDYIAEVEAIEAAAKAFEDARRARDEMARSQAEYIEAELAALGARMMRPYEHWNEDEAYVAYQERDR